MDTYTYNFPTTIRFGAGVIKELPEHLIENGIRAPLIVTDTTCSKLPFFESIIDSLQAKNLVVTIFDDIHNNPIKSDVESGTKVYLDGECDGIIGLGGGASMDVARAIALLAYHGGDLFDYEESKGGDKLITDEIPYFITIPTTSGTGSEVGRSAVISDDKTHQKKIIFSPYLIAKRVFADPELTATLPPHITAATGIDALTHHIEALFAKGFNPLCDGIAVEGIRLIWKNIEAATHKPTMESRSAMMIAALMGAVSFQKGLGVVHSMAHSLSTLFDVHHGLANAIMLAHGMRFNAPHCPEVMKRLRHALDDYDVCEAIQKLNSRLELPTNLKTIGIKESDIERLAKLAVLDPCHQCNPCPVTEQNFKNMYRDAL